MGKHNGLRWSWAVLGYPKFINSRTSYKKPMYDIMIMKLNIIINIILYIYCSSNGGSPLLLDYNSNGRFPCLSTEPNLNKNWISSGLRMKYDSFLG